MKKRLPFAMEEENHQEEARIDCLMTFSTFRFDRQRDEHQECDAFGSMVPRCCFRAIP